jgi:hypothetical protein
MSAVHGEHEKTPVFAGVFEGRVRVQARTFMNKS